MKRSSYLFNGGRTAENGTRRATDWKEEQSDRIKGDLPNGYIYQIELVSGSCARVMYTAEFTGGLSRGVCSPDYHHTPQIICYIVVLKVLYILGIVFIKVRSKFHV